MSDSHSSECDMWNETHFTTWSGLTLSSCAMIVFKSIYTPTVNIIGYLTEADILTKTLQTQAHCPIRAHLRGVLCNLIAIYFILCVDRGYNHQRNPEKPCYTDKRTWKLYTPGLMQFIKQTSRSLLLWCTSAVFGCIFLTRKRTGVWGIIRHIKTTHVSFTHTYTHVLV